MIPKTVKIGWKTYTVEVVPSDKELVIENDVCYGHIDYDHALIRIAGKYPAAQQKATLLHEIVHGVVDLQNLDLNEDEVTRLANGLYGVFVDNGTQML